MTEYTFEHEVCSKCKRKQYCILLGKAFFCENCFAWTKEYAHVKDEIRKMMIECGIEHDIEPIHDTRDLD